MHLIKIKKRAEKELRKLPITVLQKVAGAIDGLSSNPRPE